jgi:hypothetical protein
MVLPWIAAAAALAAAVAAWARLRQHARRLEQLTQMYWELKYQYGELRSQLKQVTGEVPPRASSARDASPSTPERSAATDAFVPLASLRR